MILGLRIESQGVNALVVLSNVKRMLKDEENQLHRSIQLFIQCLIVLSVIAFSIATLPDLSAQLRRWLYYIEVFTVMMFTLEYMARLLIAERPIKYLFSFYGIVDLLAIVPFYLATGTDLTTLRALRLISLIRVFKLLRYNSALKRFHRALVIAKEEIVLFGIVAMILMFLSSVGIHHFEHEAQPELFKSVFHSLWWAVVTLTTVGYGDMYPITTGGRVFTFFLLMIGLGIVAIPTGLVASALSKAREEEAEEAAQAKKDAEKVENENEKAQVTS